MLQKLDQLQFLSGLRGRQLSHDGEHSDAGLSGDISGLSPPLHHHLSLLPQPRMSPYQSPHQHVRLPGSQQPLLAPLVPAGPLLPGCLVR